MTDNYLLIIKSFLIRVSISTHLHECAVKACATLSSRDWHSAACHEHSHLLAVCTAIQSKSSSLANHTDKVASHLVIHNCGSSLGRITLAPSPQLGDAIVLLLLLRLHLRNLQRICWGEALSVVLRRGTVLGTWFRRRFKSSACTLSLSWRELCTPICTGECQQHDRSKQQHMAWPTNRCSSIRHAHPIDAYGRLAAASEAS